MKNVDGKSCAVSHAILRCCAQTLTPWCMNRMGDAHMSSSGLMFSMDAQTFHTNFLQNINDDQVKGW